MFAAVKNSFLGQTAFLVKQENVQLKEGKTFLKTTIPTETENRLLLFMPSPIHLVSTANKKIGMCTLVYRKESRNNMCFGVWMFMRALLHAFDCTPTCISTPSLSFSNLVRFHENNHSPKFSLSMSCLMGKAANIDDCIK